MSPAQALVILSGGQDSTTCLFEALHGNLSHYDKVHAITFDYRQKHSLEILAAKQVAMRAGVASHEIIEVPRILRGASPLVNENTELETYKDFKTMDAIIGARVELTFVPMRNPFFLTIAANRAACLGDNVTLFTGVCQMDNANYPDCRDTFLDSMMTMIKAALGPETLINLKAPLLYRTKAASIELAKTLPGCMEALAYSHTCYAGVYPPCGVCHACVLRAEGFKEAGVADPLIERALHEEAVQGVAYTPVSSAQQAGTQQEQNGAGSVAQTISHRIVAQIYSRLGRQLEPSVALSLYNILEPPVTYDEWMYKLSSER